MSLNYARQRLEAFLAEVRRLQEIEFPYVYPLEALHEIEAYFVRFERRLARLHENSDPEVVRQECAVTLDELIRQLPLLGFILRSTNVRNAFEVLGPLARIAGDILEPGTAIKQRSIRLIISSEWEYSPLTYSEITSLAGFVLIGFPATESGNALLIPLAGHEIGHPLANRLSLDALFRQHLTGAVLDLIRADLAKFQQTFQRNDANDRNIEEDLFLKALWTNAVAWAGRQTEETFCDFVGIRLFGPAYLYAFAYLLSPGTSVGRSPRYPAIATRVDNLKMAVTHFGYPVPPGFDGAFELRSASAQLREPEQFNLNLADGALKRVIPDLLALVARELAHVPMIDKHEIERIVSRYKVMVPAEKTRSLADIINAGWRVNEDVNFWKDTPFANKRVTILRELVLKNIEVFEIEKTRGDYADVAQ